MKKQLLILFALTLLPVAARSEIVEVDGIFYNLIKKGNVAEVTKNPNGYNIIGELIIPSSITYEGESYIVTKIVDINESGYWNGVFAECNYITKVILPSSLKRIGKYAFAGCRGLSDFEIPNGVLEIGEAAFMNSSISSVTIPSSMTKIESGAFRDCSALQSVYITDLKAWCEMSFGETGDSPFCGTVADSFVKYHLYLNGEEIKDLTIPQSVTKINDYAFYGCVGLSSITIPEGVTSIGFCVFYGCTGLVTISIPKTILSIEGSAFRYCTNLKSVMITDLKAWCQISFAGNASEEWTVSNPLSYAHHLFLNGNEITDLVLPSSITSIKNLTFYKCSGFKMITLSNSITSIGNGAFGGCENLSSIIIPNNVTTIDERAFDGCSNLSYLSIGENVDFIGRKAFSDCKELRDVYCFAKNVPSMNWGANYWSDIFEDSYIEYATLHVIDDSYSFYATTEPWKNFGSIVGINGGGESQVCAKPTISYDEGKLTFSCATEGATCQYSITDDDIKSGTGNELQLTATYNISVYAAKSGYVNSETATATLVWTSASITETPPASSIANVPAQAVLIQSNNGVLTIQGIEVGTAIRAYNTSGVQTASTISKGSSATLDTHLPPGSIAIVKIGEKTVKLVVE